MNASLHKLLGLAFATALLAGCSGPDYSQVPNAKLPENARPGTPPPPPGPGGPTKIIPDRSKGPGSAPAMPPAPPLPGK